MKTFRGLFRFRLRSLLLAICLFGVIVGIAGNRIYRQKSAIGWVRQNGGSASYDYSWTGRGAFNTPRMPNWLCNIAGFDTFASIYSVDLENAIVENIEPIRNFPHLGRLYAPNSNISDIQPLRNLTNIYELNLAGTNVVDYSPIIDHPNLIYLTVPDSISDETFQMLFDEMPECYVGRESEDWDLVRDRRDKINAE